jgi:hypothetical protein
MGAAGLLALVGPREQQAQEAVARATRGTARLASKTSA